MYPSILMLCNEDGILLLEVNRMLRAGGYFAWAAQPVYKHEQALEEQWEGRNNGPRLILSILRNVITNVLTMHLQIQF